MVAMHYGLSPIERGQFRFFRFCMKISLSLSNSMIFSRSPLLKTRKNAKIGLFQTLTPLFTMKTASFSIAILNFFSRHGQYFHPTKDQPRTRPSSTFLYICYNFRQIFCTNVIQFFSVENMGHNQLQKCTKYHLVSLLNEKQGSTFANFLHFFYPVTLLTHSAMFSHF